MSYIDLLHNISTIYNSIQNISLINRIPFLLLEKGKDSENSESALYIFKNPITGFRTEPFELKKLYFKEFTFLTPIRFYLNKILFSNIQKIIASNQYDIYISFNNFLSLNISFYNKVKIDIHKFKIKLMSGSYNLSIFDIFIYYFKLDKSQRLKYKIQKNEIVLKELKERQNVEKLMVNPHKSLKDTKRLLKQIRKKIKKENKEKDDITLEKFFEDERKQYTKDMNKE